MRLRLLVAGLCLAWVACATNPVTGQHEVILMSPEREAALGREAAQQVAQEMGLVEDPALAAFVDAIGQRVAARSPRKDVRFQFQVADMAETNAFALPGGYIYVSRGLLALVRDEDELANVLAHEVGHVAARHARCISNKFSNVLWEFTGGERWESLCVRVFSLTWTA